MLPAASGLLPLRASVFAPQPLVFTLGVRALALVGEQLSVVCQLLAKICDLISLISDAISSISEIFAPTDFRLTPRDSHLTLIKRGGLALKVARRVGTIVSDHNSTLNP